MDNIKNKLTVMAGKISFKRKTGDKLFALFLIIPALFMTAVFIYVPIVDSVIKSFQDFRVRNIVQGTPGVWNNFENYIRLYNGDRIAGAITNTFTFVIFVVVIQFILAMALAMIIDSKIPGARFFRSIIMTPWVVPTVISALIWMWIFQPQYGMLKYFVSVITGGAISDFAMLNNPSTALFGVGIAALWKQIPLTTLLFLAGLQNVPEDTMEAARIDGAGKWRVFISIILPYMKSVIKIAMSMAIIANFKQFPLIWVMTGGGPVNSTSTLAILSYREAFVSNNLGSGAAVTTIWMLLMIIVTFGYNKIVGNTEVD